MPIEIMSYFMSRNGLKCFQAFKVYHATSDCERSIRIISRHDRRRIHNLSQRIDISARRLIKIASPGLRKRGHQKRFEHLVLQERLIADKLPKAAIERLIFGFERKPLQLLQVTEEYPRIPCEDVHLRERRETVQHHQLLRIAGCYNLLLPRYIHLT